MEATRKALPATRRVSEHPHPDYAEAVAVSRFWRLVDARSELECWPWKGSTNHGYGEFHYGGRMRPAHELALSFSVGEARLPGMDTCHACDNPLCCNPTHLRFGSRQSNVDEMWDRGRNALPGTRLTVESVREIRERRALGARQSDLAAQYGISAAYVSDIVNGLCWQGAGGPITGRSKRTKRTPRSRQGKAA